MEHYGLFIDGEESDGATGERMPVIYPYTGEAFATVSVATAADVERAVAGAERAYREYLRGMAAHERARLSREHSSHSRRRQTFCPRAER